MYENISRLDLCMKVNIFPSNLRRQLFFLPIDDYNEHIAAGRCMCVCVCLHNHRGIYPAETFYVATGHSGGGLFCTTVIILFD